MAEVDPDQEAALRRLRAAFGFVEILRIIDHDTGHDLDADEVAEEGDQDDEPVGGRGLGREPLAAEPGEGAQVDPPAPQLVVTRGSLRCSRWCRCPSC
jgi:hypothetical protein